MGEVGVWMVRPQSLALSHCLLCSGTQAGKWEGKDAKSSQCPLVEQSRTPRAEVDSYPDLISW